MTSAAGSETTDLFLIRHGATEANLRRPYVLQGRGIDFPLCEIGRRQAEGVADFLASFQISRVYSSPLKRAAETARAIAGRHGLDVEVHSDLIECHVGRWEGLDWETIRREFPDSFREFDEDPARVPYLEGESYGDVLRRARPALDTLLERHKGETLVVVAHNVVNRVCAADLLGLDLNKARHLHQSNGGVNLIRSSGGQTRLVTLNAVFHLEASLRT